MRRAVFLAGVVGLLVAGTVSAGSYMQPPGDCCPHNVKPDGSSNTTIATTSSGEFVPAWPPDSTSLGCWTDKKYRTMLTVKRIGGATSSFAIAGASGGGDIVWAPKGKTVYADGRAGLVGIALATAKRTTIAGIHSAVFSLSGAEIAYVEGGECRDRNGIYVANADGTNRRRLTNSCRVVGTADPDVLHGSFSQVVLGLRGNDTRTTPTTSSTATRSTAGRGTTT